MPDAGVFPNSFLVPCRLLQCLCPQGPPPTPALQNLELDENRLTGSLDNLMGLPHLTSVGLRHNQLTGKIPTSIKGLTSLSKSE